MKGRSPSAQPPAPLIEHVFITVSDFAGRTSMSRRTVYRWCAKHAVTIEDGRITLAELRSKAFNVWNGLIQADIARTAAEQFR